ncbi:MAG: zinc ABC transporter ATP-binding protein AztA [Acidimicrobiia bacterium]
MRLKRAAVTAEDLVLGYGGRVVIDRSSFEIPSGKITAVIGPNGSGKSTLLNCVAGLIEPMGGSIHSIEDRRRVAYVMQATKVSDALPLSVAEVVTMGRYAETGPYRRLDPADHAAVAGAMERLGITGIAESRLNEVSGGQRQRAFLAQGLAQDHDILLLDEPLTGIDLTTAMAIDEIIHQEVEEGCAVVMTTHDLSEAGVADHVVLLSGRVIESGPPDRVLTAGNLAEAYGSSLLHVEDGRVLLDDAAHSPVVGHHVHRERVIHTEAEPSDLHDAT